MPHNGVCPECGDLTYFDEDEDGEPTEWYCYYPYCSNSVYEKGKLKEVYGIKSDTEEDQYKEQ